MKIRIFLAITVVLIMISGLNMYSQDYKDLTTCFDKWTSVMKHYTKEMSECTDLEKLSANCVELADSVTFYYPKMIKIREKYPEIVESGPPAELKDYFTNLDMVESKYNDMLNGLVKTANSNSENEAFQTAFGKLNMAIYNAMH